MSKLTVYGKTRRSHKLIDDKKATLYMSRNGGYYGGATLIAYATGDIFDAHRVEIEFSPDEVMALAAELLTAHPGSEKFAAFRAKYPEAA